MSCRRAFELDLSAYLVDPRAAEWTDFRDHWPTCADCAAEVAAWTALLARLGPSHPDAEVLLRWSDGGDAMPAAERLAVARHVETCPSCTDELRALARFDTAPHVAAAPLETARRPWTIRRVLWSPAVAYALLLLALVPTLRERHDEARPQGELASSPVPQASIPDEPPAEVPLPPASGEHEAPADGHGFGGTLQRSDDAGPEGRARGLGGAATAPPPPPPAPAPERKTAEPKTAEPTMVERDEARVAPDATAGVPAARRAPQAQPSAPSKTAALPTSLAIPLPDAARTAGVVELRIRDADGDREMRERFPVHPDLAILSFELPASWNDHTTYEVELRVPGTDVVERRSITVP